MDKSLINIIFKLSKKEKDFFTKFISLSKVVGAKYLSVYKHILKYENFDIKKLTNEIKNKSFFKFTSVEKGRLLDKILMSLVVFNFENKFHWSIQKDILFSKVLIEKELFYKAQKFLSRAKKNAYHYEEYDLLLNIIGLEEILCFKNCFILKFDKLLDLEKERKEIFELLNKLNFFLTFKAELQNFQLNKFYYTSDLKPIIDKYESNPLFSPSKSIKVNSNYLYINVFKSFLLHDYQTSFKNEKEFYYLYHKYPYFFSNEEYLQMMNNYLYVCCLTNNVETFFEIMNELKSYKTHNISDEIYIKRVFYYRTLQIYHRTSKFDEAEIIAKETEDFIEKYKHILETIDIIYLQIHIIIAYIDKNNYIAANKCIQKKFKAKYFESNTPFLKLFELLIQFKLGNYEVLLCSLSSWTKVISGKRNQNPYEKCLFKFFRVVCNTTNNEERIILLRNTSIQLKEISAANPNHLINLFFDFAAWFERELEEMK